VAQRGLIQEIEEYQERLAYFEKDIKKLKTASVSHSDWREEARRMIKLWLPLAGVIESNPAVSAATLADIQTKLERLRDLAVGKNPKKQYLAVLKVVLPEIENQVLNPLIKQSGLKATPETLGRLFAGIPVDADMRSYLDEALTCARNDCFRAAVIMGWCAAAYRIHRKLLGLGLPQLEAEFDKMRLENKHQLFRAFSKTYVVKTAADIEEVPDAHLVLLCRFQGWLDDSQYKQLRVCIDLRNACAHPAQYQLDSVKLQVYFADLVQLVLGNPRFDLLAHRRAHSGGATSLG
jgi:hypothetical protein